MNMKRRGIFYPQTFGDLRVHGSQVTFPPDTWIREYGLTETGNPYLIVIHESLPVAQDGMEIPTLRLETVTKWTF